MGVVRRRRDPVDRITDRVDMSGECWVWTAYLNHAGYGQMALDGVRHPAHRAVYMVLVGPIPEGLDLDHLCRNRACVNPDHLEPVTRSVNLSRGVGSGPRAALVTHCPAGHPYSPQNTYLSKRGRNCRACHRISNREYARRKASL